MKLSVKVYYVMLALIISAQAITTVYQLGSTIGHGEKISKLEQTVASKEKQLSLLQEEKYQTYSLTALAIREDDSYHPIGKPITLLESNSLASR
ncbi:MAG: hypothetical protein ACOZAK_01970 [Patescibacteria group bacterium]